MTINGYNDELPSNNSNDHPVNGSINNGIVTVNENISVTLGASVSAGTITLAPNTTLNLVNRGLILSNYTNHQVTTHFDDLNDIDLLGALGLTVSEHHQA